MGLELTTDLLLVTLPTGFGPSRFETNKLRLHYNAVSLWLPNIFLVKCVKNSADDRSIHNASCENHTPCVFPSQV